MIDTTTIAPNGTTAIGKPVGVSGVVEVGGLLVSSDYDQAWKGVKRDSTIQQMLNDPLIGAVLMGVEMLVRRVDWRVDAADESAEAEAAAAFVRDCLDDMAGNWPGDTLAKILTYLGWGWSCLELVYKRRAGPDGTPPSRFSDGKVGWHRWALRPQITRYGWRFDGDDPTVLIQQDPATFRRIDVPLAKCLLFRYASRDNSPEGFSPMRVAFDAWYNKRKLQKVALIGIERDLAGLPVGRVPAKEIAANSAVYQAMQTIVTNIRNDAQAGLVLAGDRDDTGNFYQDVSLLATGGQRAFDPVPYIKHFANEVVTVFLANVMRTGQDATGSYALADVQGGLFQQAIGAHLDTIAQTINEQAVAPLCRLNGIAPELVPTLGHGDIESADLQRLGAYVVALGQAGLIEDTPELRSFLHEVAGLPAPTAEEIAAEQAKREAEAEKARRDAARQAQAAQTAPGDGMSQEGGQDVPAGNAANQDGNAGGAPNARAMTGARTFALVTQPAVRVTVSDDDLAEAEALFDRLMPDAAEALSARSERAS